MSNRYIVTAHRGNLLVIDQQRAHERIIYEYYVNIRKEQAVHSQQLLFPEQLEMSAGDFSLTKDLLDEFKSMGFDLDVFGKNSIVVNGAPADLKDFNIVATIEGILETYKLNAMEAKVEKHENLSKAIARNTCIRNGKSLQKEEMRMLVENLFNCENPLFSPFGKPVMLEVNGTEIEKFFRK
jgi:DNA mismatch repair protein MutL